MKHAVQNTQNGCHQWLSDISKLHQIRFWPGLRPGPRWGSLQRSPDPLTGLRGPTCKIREERRGEGGNGREGENKPSYFPERSDASVQQTYTETTPRATSVEIGPIACDAA